MNLISLNFITFAVITIIAYFIAPQKHRWFVLLISSLVFYYDVGVRALVTLITVSLITFLAAIVIENSPVETKKRRFILSCAVILIVGWLAFTKISELYDWNYYLVVVPLGISYVSFSLISYLADVYWEKDIAERKYLKFLTYVLFFPKISQGPITRHKDLSVQLYGGSGFSYEAVCFGSQRMIYGYFKKLVIADRAAMFTTPVFLDVSQYSGSIIIVASMVAALQLYCDFSGYMDIVLGFTEILGIRMDENFNHPFFSKSAAEFWRRWHITLGEVFKDYVYTPVVMSSLVKKTGKWCRKRIGKRFGNSIMKVIALSAVWILTGMWHGTGVNYILWGAYWGGGIIFSTVFEDEIKKLNQFLHINTKAESWKVFQMLRTFLLFCFGIMVTRLRNVDEIKLVGHNLLTKFNLWDLFDGTLYSIGLNKVNFNIMLISLLLVWLISLLQEKKRVRQSISKFNAPVRWIIYAASVSIVLLLGIYGSEYSTAGFAYTHF